MEVLSKRKHATNYSWIKRGNNTKELTQPLIPGTKILYNMNIYYRYCTVHTLHILYPVVCIVQAELFGVEPELNSAPGCQKPEPGPAKMALLYAVPTNHHSIILETPF